MSTLSNTAPALRRAWHPVARSDEVGDSPLGVQLLGEHWVLVRLGPDLCAFPDRCPHRLVPLSAGWIDNVADRTVLRCGYHGWCFTADGACVEIPALGSTDHVPPRAHLVAPAGLAERHGLVWLAPDAPLVPILEFAELDDPAFVAAEVQCVRARVGAGQIIDNFLDMSHFPFVHAATIGSPGSDIADDMRIERDGFAMTVRCEHEFANHDDPGVADGTRALVQRRRVEYTYAAPFAIRLRLDFVDAGGSDAISMFVQPENDESCRLYLHVVRAGERTEPDQMTDLVKYELSILDEDLLIQERYEDRDLPLDPTVETHVRTDRPALELRRILADFVA